MPHSTMQVTSPRRYLVTFVSAVIVSALALAGFNYVVNPLGYYAPRLVGPIVWGDQHIKLDLMKQGPAPDVFILGSSRVSKLSPADVTALTGQHAFNGAVSSSRPDEYYAMLRYALDDLHWNIREVIIGIDPETLSYAGPPNTDVISRAELRQYLPWRMWAPELLGRAKLLLSTYNLDLSVKALKRSLTSAPPPSPIKFDPDGYLHYLVMEQQIAAGTFHLAPEANFPNYRERYEGLAGLDPQRKALFEQMLQLAAQRSIRVRIFATPFHPTLLGAMRQVDSFNQVRAAVLPYLQDLPGRYTGVSFNDFTEVASFGGDPDAFFDGVHYRQENGRLMLQHLYGK